MGKILSMVREDQSPNNGTKSTQPTTNLPKEAIMLVYEQARYVLPDIEDEEIKYRPYVVNEKCQEDIFGVLEAWRTRYSVPRFALASILEGLIQRLEKDAHAERREKKAAKNQKKT